MIHRVFKQVTAGWNVLVVVIMFVFVSSGEGTAVDDNTVNDEDANLEYPPTLCEALTMVNRLHLLSTTRHPGLHVFISQFQSRLIDIYLGSNCSKQKSIRDFLKPLGLGDTI